MSARIVALVVTVSVVAFAYASTHPAGALREPRSAHETLMIAAVDGKASAAYRLGTMAANGEDGPRDPAAAARWYRRAADLGSTQATFMLANAYRAGAGVPQSDAEALVLYRRAAEREHPAALQTLALAYERGEMGLARDPEEARRLEMESAHAVGHAPPF